MRQPYRLRCSAGCTYLGWLLLAACLVCFDPDQAPIYCRHSRRRPSKVVYVPDTGSNERNCVQPCGPSLRGSLEGTEIAPTRSTDSICGLSAAEGTPCGCFAVAGLSCAVVRFSSLVAGCFTSGAGFASAGRLSAAPTVSLFDGATISAPAAVLRLSSAVVRLSRRTVSTLNCSVNTFRSACSTDRRVEIACIVSCCGACDVSCFGCKAENKNEYSLAGLFVHKNVPRTPPKTKTNNHGTIRCGRAAG